MAKEFTFFKTSIDELKAMAAFCSELERQGTAYNVTHDAHKFYIEITGY